MRENYKTIGNGKESEITIQKSRFIAHAKRAETEKEALEFIDSIKAQHKSANHNCSAYMIGEHDSIQKANDDGEPSGTAGVPMLEVLKKQGLKDTVVVVTRYFGGIKLGGGGLIRAYGKATTEAIAAAGVVERRLHCLMNVQVDYTWLGKIENEIRQSDFPLKEILYTEGVELLINVPVEQEQQFSDWINEMTNGQVKIVCQEKEFLEFKIS
ncbi:IMPACT family member YigZ [Planococcus massiliensis]|uniref:IMPACT family member YigZ n=1 Tax=Planococcus massiliensis TaxID=1499687 RepID=A0A098EK12_9BACL|nr:YigZ family protein [Planococcus massiliensis]CEG22212.1 IMPACT family member YigZ [Planococcus massiliensis]